MKKIIIFGLILLLNTHIFASDEIVNDFSIRTFKELDMNKDNVIDESDINAFSKKEFELSDIDKNGLLSKEEFFEFICEKSCANGECECKNYENKEELDYIREYWNIIDADGDGNITMMEKLNDDLNNFYLLDSNKDGKVLKEDLEAQFY